MDVLNWNLDRLPAAADDVTIGTNAPATVTILGALNRNGGYLAANAQAHSVHSAVRLEIPSNSFLDIAAPSELAGGFTLTGTLTGSGDLALPVGMDWIGGTMSGTGTTYIPAGATASFTGSVPNSIASLTLLRSLDVVGVVNVNNSSLLVGRSASTTASLRIHDGGLIEFGDSSSLNFGNGSGTPIGIDVQNGGTLRNTNRGGLRPDIIPLHLHAGSILESTRGVVAIGNGVYDGGTFVAAPSTIPNDPSAAGFTFNGLINASIHIAAGMSFGLGLPGAASGPTTAELADGVTIDVDGTLTVGTISGAGDVVIHARGQLFWNSGEMRGSGVTRVEAGGTARVGPMDAFSGVQVRLARTFDVAGTLTIDDHVNVFYFGSTVAPADIGRLHVTPGGLVNLLGGAAFSALTPGTLAHRIDIDGGTCRAAGEGIAWSNAQINVPINLSNGATLTAVNLGAISMSGGGSFVGNNTISAASNRSIGLNAGTWSASGGRLDIVDAVAGASPRGSVAIAAPIASPKLPAKLEIAGDASVRVAGSLVVYPTAEITGAGSLDVVSGGTVGDTGGTVPSQAPLFSGTGRVNIAAGGAIKFDTLITARQIHIAGTATIGGPVGAVSLRGAGSLFVEAGSTATLGGTYTGDSDGTGSIEIASGATATLKFGSRFVVPIHNFGTINGQAAVSITKQDLDYLTGVWTGSFNFTPATSGTRVFLHDIRGTLTNDTALGLSELNRISGTLNLTSTGLVNGAPPPVTPAGGTLVVTGNLQLGARAAFAVIGNARFSEAGSPTLRTAISSDTQFSQFTVTGTLDLTDPAAVTRLEVSTVGTYDPAAGTTYPIVVASGGVLGAFDRYVQTPTPSGKALLVTRPDANTIAITVGDGAAAAAPKLTSATFDYAAGDIVALTFDQDVSALLARKEFKLRNLTTGVDVSPALGTVAYDVTQNRATLTFAGGLPDGDYRLTIDAADVDNSAGVPLAAPISLDFFTLRGDINRDRKIDFSDLLIVAQNYGQSGRTFAQGNLDHSADGAVNFSDLLILAQQYGKGLAALPTANVAAKASSKRVAKSVLD